MLSYIMDNNMTFGGHIFLFVAQIEAFVLERSESENITMMDANKQIDIMTDKSYYVFIIIINYFEFQKSSGILRPISGRADTK